MGQVAQHSSEAKVIFMVTKQRNKTLSFYHVQEVFVALAINVVPSTAATKTGSGLCAEDVLKAMWKVTYQMSVFQYIPVRIFQNFGNYIASLHQSWQLFCII